MRELDRIAVIGAGRLGTALTTALHEASLDVQGPLRRGETPAPGTTLVLLCVPDGAIADVQVAPGPLVGHCSGATPLGDFDFALHPLMTVLGNGAASFPKCAAAVAGHPVAAELARRLGMVPIEVAEDDRAAYHAAASIASNFLVTLECAAERVGATAGIDRTHLAPLIRATVDNWERDGRAALTGPIARGDTATVQRHRAALTERAPELLALYDVLAEATAA